MELSPRHRALTALEQLSRLGHGEVARTGAACLRNLASAGGAGLLTAGTAYQVTVATQPLGLTCTVLNGTGTISSASAAAATPITVTCS